MQSMLGGIAMGYYNYHAMLKQRLETLPYEVAEETGKYSHRFIFPTEVITMPIKPERQPQYKKYIDRQKEGGEDESK